MGIILTATVTGIRMKLPKDKKKNDDSISDEFFKDICDW